MKRVIQLDDNGCGVACIAMLAGVSYKQVRRAMVGDWARNGIGTKELRDALRKFRLSPAKRLVRSTKRRHYTTLQQDAVLKVKLPKSKGRKWHWIVWDAKRRTFHDPDRNPFLKPRVSSYLVVRRD